MIPSITSLRLQNRGYQIDHPDCPTPLSVAFIYPFHALVKRNVTTYLETLPRRRADGLHTPAWQSSDLSSSA